MGAFCALCFAWLLTLLLVQFEPVHLDGASLERASLHNWDFVARHALRPGSPVVVERAGGVIPRVVPVPVPGAPPALVPPHCPCAARAPLVVRQLHLCCTSADCQPRLAYRASAAAQALAVPGVGPAQAQRLAEAGLLVPSEPWRLFAVTPALLEARGWKAPAAARLCDALCAGAARATLADVIGLLDADGLGPAAAEALALHFASLAALRAADPAQLAAVPGVGPALAGALAARLRELGPHLDAALRSCGLPVASGQAAVPLRWAGRRACLTGHMAQQPRARLAATLRSLGASVSADVTRHTDVLVCGADPAPSLVAKAKRLGVRVVTELVFMAELK